MKRRKVIGSIIIGIVFLIGCSFKNQNLKIIENVVWERDNKYSCFFDGVRHDFIVELPDNVRGAPLVVMLHGYGETAESFRKAVCFEEKANPLGYAVVYVTGAANPNDSTSSIGWNSGLGEEGNNDVEFLVALTEYLQKEYSLNKKRIFAVGFSNGAFMTHRLAMEAEDTFSACVSVAGMMPESIWDKRKALNEVSFFQITGERDNVVPKNIDGSAKYSNAPAIEDVIEYWAKSNGLEFEKLYGIGTEAVLSKYGSRNNKKQVWHLLIKEGYHSWPREEFNGIDANTIILEFLETQE